MLPRTRVSTSLSNFFRWGVGRGLSPYPTFFRLGQSHFPTFFGSAKVGSRLFSARRNWDFDFFRHEPEMGLCHISASRAPEFRSSGDLRLRSSGVPGNPGSGVPGIRGSPAPEFRKPGDPRLRSSGVKGIVIIIIIIIIFIRIPGVGDPGI